MLGSQVIARILKLEGVKQVFCFPFTPILDALAVEGIRPIVARQERVAVNMADGYSRVSFGKHIGVVSVQQGPGSENAFAGIAQARSDSSPVLFLPGHPGRDRIGVPPTFEALENYKNATKWADRIMSASNIPNRMERAFLALRTGSPGPVLLELPIDVTEEKFSGSLDYRSVQSAKSGGDPFAIQESVKLLLAAKHPIIWAGQGVLYAEASKELTRLAELIGAPVMTSLQGKSAFNEKHSLSLGSTGYSQTDMVGHYLEQSDAIFVVGSSLTKSLFAPTIPNGSRILIHATVDWHDLYKDYRPDVPILGDARLILQQMLEEVHLQQREKGKSSNEKLENNLKNAREQWKNRWQSNLESSQIPISPYRVIGDIMKIVDPATTIITHDSGTPRDQLAPIYEAVNPRGYLGWGNSTQLGFSLGASMGAKLAIPEKLVINLMGDAAFGMVGMDVETAVREKIPILTIILNNFAMGGYEQYIPEAVARFGTKSLSGNFSEVAKGLGAYSERVEEPGEVLAALKRGIAKNQEGQPAVLEFITSEELDIATRKSP